MRPSILCTLLGAASAISRRSWEGFRVRGDMIPSILCTPLGLPQPYHAGPGRGFVLEGICYDICTVHTLLIVYSVHDTYTLYAVHCT